MTDTKYNGWTNYETWRINLEVFDGVNIEDIGANKSWSASELKDYLQDYVYNILEETGSGLALDYALAFAREANYYEIAESLINNQ